MNETKPLLLQHRRRSLYETIRPQDVESETGLAKIQGILDHMEHIEEQNLPIFRVPPKVVRTTERQTARRTTCLIWTCLATLVVTMIVGAALMLPTETEHQVAVRYYGDTPTTLRIRRAQEEADKSVIHASKFSRLLKRHHGKKHALTRAGEDMQNEAWYQSVEEGHHMADGEIYEGCETTVLILRHCEKETVAEHCAYDGFERSFYLSTLFGTRWPEPFQIYAEQPADRHNRKKRNFREIETVGPIAKKFDIPIDDSYSDVRPMAKAIWKHVQSGMLCGRLVVIAWKHTDIAHLGRLLGCGPMQGCPLDYHGKTFDDAWQVKFVYRRWPHSESKKHFAKESDDPSWRVFGSVQQERFDPLEVSYKFGGYHGPDGNGAPWRETNVTDVPERKSRNDNGIRYDQADISVIQEDA